MVPEWPPNYIASGQLETLQNSGVSFFFLALPEKLLFQSFIWNSWPQFLSYRKNKDRFGILIKRNIYVQANRAGFSIFNIVCWQYLKVNLQFFLRYYSYPRNKICFYLYEKTEGKIRKSSSVHRILCFWEFQNTHCFILGQK